MQAFLRRRLADLLFFVILMVALGVFAHILHIRPVYVPGASGTNLILQAQAWLRGRLDIGFPIHDSIVLHGKYYIIYPPLPALLMVPFIAVLGNHFSDVWFTWAFAALNIILVFRALEVMRVRQITRRTPLENAILALTFGFGTIALWLALGGRVWFTLQVVSVFGIFITLHSTLSRHWPLATLGLGIVVLSRTSDALVGLFPLVVYLYDLGVGQRVQNKRRWWPQRWPALRELALTLAPFVVALAIFLIHNQLYFGNMLSSGYDIQNQQDYPDIKYGLLSWHYLWPNIVVAFLRGPAFHFTGLTDVNPQMDLFIDSMGTSIFFTTPLMALFIFAAQGKTAHAWLRRALWATVGVMLLAILLFCAEGWSQVGARYLFGIYPPLFLLLAMRAAPLDTRWISLAGLGVFVNLLLAYVFWMHKEPGHKFILASGLTVVCACTLALFLLHRQKSPQTQGEAVTQAASTVPEFADEPTDKLLVVGKQSL